MQAEIEFNESIINESQEGIEDIQRSVLQVNEIFTDLAQIVEDQSYQADTIENNVTQAADRAKAGLDELNQADEYQERHRKRCQCVIMLFLLAIVGVVLWAFMQ